MAYADVTNPVIVNVTKISNFSSETHLRRMAVVSPGSSNVTQGGFKSVNVNNYDSVITKGTETEKQAINFFSNAGNTKELIVVEVGSGNLEEQVANLKNFIDAEELKCFNYILPSAWYQVKTNTKAVNATMAASQVIKADATEKTLTELTLTGFDKDNYPVSVTFDTDGEVEYNPYTGIYKRTENSQDANFPVTATLTDTTKNAEIGKIKFNKADGTEQSDAINYTSNYQSPDLSVVNFVTAYNDISNEVLFFMPTPKDEDPSISPSDNYYEGLKSVMTIKENTENTAQSVTGAVVGLTASNFFDISTQMPGSSLNYKQINITPFGYTASMKKTLINRPYSFVDTLAGNNVLLNARMRDGKAWDYYYFWYLTKFSVENKITSLILTGQNNPPSAIRFNQNGIDTIHSNIVAVLNNMVSLGVLTTFAQSYDQSTGQFKGEGNIMMPEFYKFIADNPEDYANEILSGISCYLQIGKFVRQVQWNVSLGV